MDGVCRHANRDVVGGDLWPLNSGVVLCADVDLMVQFFNSGKTTKQLGVLPLGWSSCETYSRSPYLLERNLLAS